MLSANTWLGIDFTLGDLQYEQLEHVREFSIYLQLARVKVAAQLQTHRAQHYIADQDMFYTPT